MQNEAEKINAALGPEAELRIALDEARNKRRILMTLSALSEAVEGLQQFEKRTTDAATRKKCAKAATKKIGEMFALTSKLMFGDEDSGPWCDPCRSYHPKPKSKAHHKALACFAKWPGGKR
jgi:hypothetical protein